MRITWEVEGVTILDRSFSRLGQRLSDLRPVWDNVQRTFWQIEDAHFKSEGARGASGRWKALTRPYAKQKAQRWGVKTILRASDALFESLTGETGDTLLFKEPQEFGIGTRHKAAKYHQSGTSKMAKRPVIDFSESQKRDLSKGIQRDILDEIKRDGAINLEVS